MLSERSVRAVFGGRMDYVVPAIALAILLVAGLYLIQAEAVKGSETIAFLTLTLFACLVCIPLLRYRVVSEIEEIGSLSTGKYQKLEGYLEQNGYSKVEGRGQYALYKVTDFKGLGIPPKMLVILDLDILYSAAFQPGVGAFSYNYFYNKHNALSVLRNYAS